MASVKESIRVPLEQDVAWSHVCDLARFDEWLTIHDGWRSDIPEPDDLRDGLKISSVISVKNTRVRFEWTVKDFDRGSRVSLKGNGKGGVKVTVTLSVEAAGDDESQVTLDVELGGLPMVGPAGKTAAKLLRADLRESLEKFASVFTA